MLVSLEFIGETRLAEVTTVWPITSRSRSDPPPVEDDATGSIGLGLSAEGVLARSACNPGDS